MRHLEAPIAAMLRFLGVSYTEAGIHFMTPFIWLIAFLVVSMAALVISLEIRRRLPGAFERSVLADIRSL